MSLENDDKCSKKGLRMSRSHTFSWHCAAMRFMGMGMYRPPNEHNFVNFPNIPYKIYTFIVLFLSFCFVVAQVRSAILAENIDEFFFSIAMFFGHGTITFKSISWVFYNKKIQNVIYILEVEMKKYKQNAKRMRKCFVKFYIITFALVVPAFFTLSTFVYVPISKEVRRLGHAAAHGLPRSANRTLVLPHSSLFEEQSDLMYSLQLAFQLFGVYGVAVIIVDADTFVAGLLIHIAAHFQNVQDYFNEVTIKTYEELETKRRNVFILNQQNMPDDDSRNIDDTSNADDFDHLEDKIHDWFSSDEINDKIYESLKDGINAHKTLLKCTKDLQTAYGISFLGQLVFSLMSICLTLWTAVDEYTLTGTVTTVRFSQAVTFFISLSVQIYIQTSGANEVTLQAEKIAESVAQCRRYSTNRKLRRLLVIVMLRAQTPVHIHAAGFAIMSNKIFLDIMKSSYSAFAVLIRINK